VTAVVTCPLCSGADRLLAEDLGYVIRAAGPGTRLPAERDLARELGVGRARIRRALHHCQDLGLLENRPQVGWFVA